MPKKKQSSKPELVNNNLPNLQPGENLADSSLTDSQLGENQADDKLTGSITDDEDLYRRVQDLASLNQIGQNLNKLSDQNAIINLLAESIQNMLDSSRLLICTFDEENQKLIPLLYTEDGSISLLSNSTSLQAIAEEGARVRITQCVGNDEDVLVVPLLAGNKLVGVCVVLKRPASLQFSRAEVDAVVTICSQAAIALENARLFHEMEGALAELAARERYQNFVAHAVADLNDHGTAKLQDVLKNLAAAADADRITYLVITEDKPGWKTEMEYSQPSLDAISGDISELVSSKIDLPSISIKGWQQIDIDTLPDIEGNKNLRCGLLLPVLSRPGKVSGILLLISKSASCLWDIEQIRAFRLVANSLSNTNQREALHQDLESTLAETDALLRSSQRLAMVKDIPGMLNSVIEIKPGNRVDKAELILFNEDSEKSFYKFVLTAVWEKGSDTRLISPPNHYPYATYNTCFEIPDPIFSQDILTDNEIPEETRQILTLQSDCKSVAVIPLISSERQVGVLLIKSKEKGAFSSFETRAYPLLSSQMATSIENLHLTEQTQVAATEKDTLYQASAGLGLAQSYSEILDVLRQHTFLGRDCRRMDIYFFDSPWTDSDHPMRIDRRASWCDTQIPQDTGREVFDQIPLVQKILNPDSPVVIDESQPALASVLPALHKYLIDEKAVRLIYLPLSVAGKWIGYVRSAQTSLSTVSDVDIRSAMVLAGQAALAAQNIDSLDIALQSASEATILFQASQQLSLAGGEKEIFQITLQAARQAVPVQSVSIHVSILDQGKPSMRQAASLAEPGIPVQRDGSLFPARLFPYYDFSMAGQSTVSSDTQSDERLTDTARRYFQLAQTYSVAVIPMMVRGQTFGVMLAARSQRVPFSDSEVVFLESICAQAGIALENYRLLLETRLSAREAHEKTLELSLINRVVTSVSAAPDLKTGLQAVINELVDSFNLSSGGIALLNDEKTALEVYAETSHDGHAASTTIIPVKGNLSTQRVLETRQPLVVTDAQHNPLTLAVHAIMIRHGIETLTLLPLIVQNDVIGTVGLDIQEAGRTLSSEEIHLAETIVYQAAVAIQNSRLLEKTKHALAETELLYRISRSVAAAVTTKELVELVFDNALPPAAEHITFLFNQPVLAGEGREIEIVGHRSRGGEYIPDGSRIPESDLPVLTTIGENPLVIADYKTADLDTRSIETLIRLEFVSGCILPLRTSGEKIGYILVSSSQVVMFTPGELRQLQITSDGVAVALEKQRLLRQAERRAIELQTAALVARETSGTLDLDLLLKRMVDLLCERFGFYHASVFLIDEEREFAVVRESTGLAGEEMKTRGHKLAVGSRSIIGSVTATGKPLVVNDVVRSDTHRKNPLLPNTRSELGIPLKIGEKVIGALDVQSTQTNAFHPDDVAVLQILADQIAVAIENAKAYTVSLQAVDEMREADKMKSKFLANMSHELRTPLNSIIGFSRVILKGIDGPVTDIQQQDLTAIYNSGQHLLRLINDILDLSKIEAGKMEIAFNDVNLAELVNSVMSTATGLTKDKQLKIIRNIPSDLPPVRGDSVRLRQVLINLLSNAAKFTDHGTITIDAARHTGLSQQAEVIVRISDTGQGISPEHQRKLFQPFSQIDDSPTRKTGGTGLGLSISKSLIDMHGGRIGLEKSRVGEGSTFFFTLPVSGLPNVPPESGVPSRTILAIDPDMRVIHQYQSFLEPKGYQVIPLSDSSVAGYHAQRLNPLAIILDVTPRDHSGWKSVKQLRSDPETARIPMILCSMVHEEGIGFCLGVTEFLNKPLKSEVLTAALGRLGLNVKFRELLIVDDNIEDLKAIQQSFEHQPNTFITFAKDAWQARALLSKRKPSAVIMDLIKPDLYRLDLIKELRANNEYGNIPLIFLIGIDKLQENIDQLDQFNQELLSKLLSKPEGILNSLDKLLNSLQQVVKN